MLSLSLAIKHCGLVFLNSSRKPMEAKPGDKIIVTDPSLETYGKEFEVIRVDKTKDCTWIEDVLIGMIGRAWVPRRSYQILDVSYAKTLVGDRVIITDPLLKGCYCQVLIVIDKGIDWVSGVKNVDDPRGISLTVWHGHYKLLKTAPSSCPECQDTGKIELFTSTVKCGCGVKI